MPSEINNWLADLKLSADWSSRPSLRVRVKPACVALVGSGVHEPLTILPDPGFPDCLFDLPNIGNHRFDFHEDIDRIVILREFQSRDFKVGNRTFAKLQVKIACFRLNKVQGGRALQLA